MKNYYPMSIIDSMIDSNLTKTIVRLEKSYFRMKNIFQYFIKIYKIENSLMTCQGYIYFYLDELNKTSTYIGSYVKPEYRQNGMASLLTSYWIKYSLDNGYYNLETTKTQRKPFLIFILKQFSFDIKNIEDYLKSINNIHICTLPDDNTKYLLFDNPKEEKSFINGTIYRNDNYKIIRRDEEDLNIIETILLSKQLLNYNLDKALYKAESKIYQKMKR